MSRNPEFIDANDRILIKREEGTVMSEVGADIAPDEVEQGMVVQSFYNAVARNAAKHRGLPILAALASVLEGVTYHPDNRITQRVELEVGGLSKATRGYSVRKPEGELNPFKMWYEPDSMGDSMLYYNSQDGNQNVDSASLTIENVNGIARGFGKELEFQQECERLAVQNPPSGGTKPKSAQNVVHQETRYRDDDINQITDIIASLYKASYTDRRLGFKSANPGRSITVADIVEVMNEPDTQEQWKINFANLVQNRYYEAGFGNSRGIIYALEAGPKDMAVAKMEQIDRDRENGQGR